MSLHAAVPVVGFLGLVNIWVALIAFILVGAQRFDDSGINQNALPHHNTAVR